MAATGAGGPQVEEVQSLNDHERPVDQQVVTEHDNHCDREMDDGFRSNKWFGFFLEIRH